VVVYYGNMTRFWLPFLGHKNVNATIAMIQSYK